jgi:hypothetical protein
LTDGSPSDTGTRYAFPKVLAYVVNGGIALYDVGFEVLGTVTNSLWVTLYGQSPLSGTETYETLFPVPALNGFIATGWARDSAFNILPDLIFWLDADTKAITRGATLPFSPPHIPNVLAVSPVDGAVYFLTTSGSDPNHRAIVRRLDVAFNELAEIELLPAQEPTPQAIGLCVSPDGARLYASVVTDGDTPQARIFVVDTTTLEIIAFADTAAPPFSADCTALSLGEAHLFSHENSDAGDCIAVRDRVTLELAWRIPITLDNADSRNTVFVGPDETRLYVYAQDGRLLIYSAADDEFVGELVGEVDPAQFAADLGPNPTFAKNNSSQLPAGFYLAR